MKVQDLINHYAQLITQRYSAYDETVKKLGTVKPNSDDCKELEFERDYHILMINAYKEFIKNLKLIK